MTKFEYRLIVWSSDDNGSNVSAMLNALGGDGWEAVGLTPRAAPVPMAGMGTMTVPEVVVLLKRAVGT